MLIFEPFFDDFGYSKQETMIHLDLAKLWFAHLEYAMCFQLLAVISMLFETKLGTKPVSFDC